MVWRIAAWLDVLIYYQNSCSLICSNSIVTGLHAVSFKLVKNQILSFFWGEGQFYFLFLPSIRLSTCRALWGAHGNKEEWKLTTPAVPRVCRGSALTFELITVLQLKQSCSREESGSVSIPTLLPAPFILITCLAVFLHRADCYPITFILHNVNLRWPGNLNRLWCGFDAMHTVWPHCFYAVARGGTGLGTRRQLRWFVGEFDT